MAFSLRLALALDHGEDGSADALSAVDLSVRNSKDEGGRGQDGEKCVEDLFFVEHFCCESQDPKEAKN